MWEKSFAVLHHLAAFLGIQLECLWKPCRGIENLVFCPQVACLDALLLSKRLSWGKETLSFDFEKSFRTFWSSEKSNRFTGRASHQIRTRETPEQEDGRTLKEFLKRVQEKSFSNKELHQRVLKVWKKPSNRHWQVIGRRRVYMCNWLLLNKKKWPVGKPLGTTRLLPAAFFSKETSKGFYGMRVFFTTLPLICV